MAGGQIQKVVFWQKKNSNKCLELIWEWLSCMAAHVWLLFIPFILAIIPHLWLHFALPLVRDYYHHSWYENQSYNRRHAWKCHSYGFTYYFAHNWIKSVKLDKSHLLRILHVSKRFLYFSFTWTISEWSNNSTNFSSIHSIVIFVVKYTKCFLYF